jgi:hypothetical protein
MSNVQFFNTHNDSRLGFMRVNGDKQSRLKQTAPVSFEKLSPFLLTDACV